MTWCKGSQATITLIFSFGLLLNVTVAFSAAPGAARHAFAMPSARHSLFSRVSSRICNGARGKSMLKEFSTGSDLRTHGLLSLHMGRRRRGAGDQRSRWSTRIASDDPNVPQPEGEEVFLGTGENRMAKIEALVKRRQSGLILVLEDPADAMNAGAVLRSCDAFGVTEAWFVHNGVKEGTSMRPHIEIGRAFDPDSNSLQDSSASASRWVSTKVFYTTQEAIDALKHEGYTSVATCFTQNSKSLYKCDLTNDKLALWVGNEFAGLSEMAIANADIELFIPMRGMIQSLNLSVAAAVCLNEISRQRSTIENGAAWSLSEDEQRKMASTLVMRRRSFRTGPLTSESRNRLQKTWQHIMEKSNKNIKDQLPVIEHDTQ